VLAGPDPSLDFIKSYDIANNITFSSTKTHKDHLKEILKENQLYRIGFCKKLIEAILICRVSLNLILI
jgi:hypothetical protein